MASAPDPRLVAAEKRAEVYREVRWVVTLDGAEYTFRLGDVTAVDVGDLRRDAHLDVVQMVRLAEAGEPDAVAAVVWLARRQAGEGRLSFGAVAGELTLGQVYSMRDEDDDSEAEQYPDPPVSGGSSGGVSPGSPPSTD